MIFFFSPKRPERPEPLCVEPTTTLSSLSSSPENLGYSISKLKLHLIAKDGDRTFVVFPY